MNTKRKSTRTRVAGVLATAALALGTLGGGAAVTVATAEPAAAAVSLYNYTYSAHIAKSPWCWLTGQCHEGRHCVWGKNKYYPKGRWFCHIDRY